MPTDIHRFATQVFSYLLPIDFPPEPDDALDESEVLESVLTTRLSAAETAVLWCYAEAVRRLDPETTRRVELVHDALALRSAELSICRQAVDEALAASDGSPESVRALIAAPPRGFVARITRAAVDIARQSVKPRTRLRGLRGADFEHPQDRSLRDMLRSFPGLVDLASTAHDVIRRGVVVQMRADGLLVTRLSMPWLHGCYEEACRALDLGRRRPPFFLFGHGLQPTLYGVDEPAIAMPAMAVNIFDREETIFLLGRELGHIMADHPRYQACAQLSTMTADTVASSLSGVLRAPISLALGTHLYAWTRASHYTADRAGYLACQNRETALRALMKLAGFPIRHAAELRTRSLLEQAERFCDDLADDTLDNAFKLVGHVISDSPYIVRRASELMTWVEEGAYDCLLNAKR